MNPQVFDSVSRLLASRRGVVSVGSALFLGLAGDPRDAQAKCRSLRARCGKRGKCCTGARCKGGRCRCKPNAPEWAGECCKNRFALANAQGLAPIPGTEFCCAAKRVCSLDGDPEHDDCCQENETCIDGKCCCDGCRGTVICGGVCCGAASCCDGVCCPGGQICAETAPGVRTCQSATRECADDTQCYPGETCFGEICCTAGRMCMVPEGNGPDVPTCCGSNTYCYEDLDTCCSNGNICTTGKKVRIRV